MANGHGGYRKPANPAPVSGPGKYSRRTDGKPMQGKSTIPDQAYGQRSADMAAQSAAPMAGRAPLPPPARVPAQQSADQAPSAPPYEGGDFLAASARPDEHVMTGVDRGPGPGSEVLNLPTPQATQGTGAMSNLLARLSSTDMTGPLAQLLVAAQTRGV